MKLTIEERNKLTKSGWSPECMKDIYGSFKNRKLCFEMKKRYFGKICKINFLFDKKEFERLWRKRFFDVLIRFFFCKNIECVAVWQMMFTFATFAQEFAIRSMISIKNIKMMMMWNDRMGKNDAPCQKKGKKSYMSAPETHC